MARQKKTIGAETKKGAPKMRVEIEDREPPQVRREAVDPFNFICEQIYKIPINLEGFYAMSFVRSTFDKEE